MTNRLESLTQKTSDSVSVTNLEVFHELLIGYNGVLTKNFIYKHKRLHVHALINLINNKKIVMLENDT